MNQDKKITESRQFSDHHEKDPELTKQKDKKHDKENINLNKSNNKINNIKCIKLPNYDLRQVQQSQSNSSQSNTSSQGRSNEQSPQISQSQHDQSESTDSQQQSSFSMQQSEWLQQQQQQKQSIKQHNDPYILWQQFPCSGVSNQTGFISCIKMTNIKTQTNNCQLLLKQSAPIAYKFTKCSTIYKVNYRESCQLQQKLIKLDQLMYQHRKFAYCQNIWVINGKRQINLGINITNKTLQLLSFIQQTQIQSLIIQNQPLEQITNKKQLQNLSQNTCVQQPLPSEISLCFKLFHNISNISFPCLRELSLKNNALVSMQPIYELISFISFKRMKSIDLSDNYFTSFKGFASKTRINVSQRLSLRGNRFNDQDFSQYFSRIDVFALFKSKSRQKGNQSARYVNQKREKYQGGQCLILGKLQIDYSQAYFKQNSDQGSNQESSNQQNSLNRPQTMDQLDESINQLDENMQYHRYHSKDEHHSSSQEQDSSNQNQVAGNQDNGYPYQQQENQILIRQQSRNQIQCHNYTFLAKVQTQQLKSLQYSQSPEGLFTYRTAVQKAVRRRYLYLWL